MSVENFLEEMRASYVAKDAQMMSAQHCIPFTIIEETQTHTVTTLEDLNQRAEFIMSLIEQAGIVDLSFKLVSQMAAGGCLTIVRFENIMHFKDGTSTLPAFVTMILRETDGRYGIAATINPIIKLAHMG